MAGRPAPTPTHPCGTTGETSRRRPVRTRLVSQDFSTVTGLTTGCGPRYWRKGGETSVVLPPNHSTTCRNPRGRGDRPSRRLPEGLRTRDPSSDPSSGRVGPSFTPTAQSVIRPPWEGGGSSLRCPGEVKGPVPPVVPGPYRRPIAGDHRSFPACHTETPHFPADPVNPFRVSGRVRSLPSGAGRGSVSHPSCVPPQSVGTPGHRSWTALPLTTRTRKTDKDRGGDTV